jgi:hypothetical protein
MRTMPMKAAISRRQHGNTGGFEGSETARAMAEAGVESPMPPSISIAIASAGDGDETA